MKVFVSARLPEQVLDKIARDHSIEAHGEHTPIEREKLLASIEDKDGLLCTITDRIDEELLERAPGLKIIANNGVGFDHIDLGAATRDHLPAGTVAAADPEDRPTAPGVRAAPAEGLDRTRHA